jgi:hypothetical protein
VARFDKDQKRVDFKLKFSDASNLTGPSKAAIALQLGPEFEKNKNGTFSSTISGPTQNVELFSEDLAFIDNTLREGRVYVSVDGYERAFAYPVALTGSGDLDEVALGQRVAARIRVPRYTKPSGKFRVYLEMDGPLSPEYSLELGVDRAGTREQFETQTFTGLRQQRVTMAFSEAGDLVLQTKVQDWQAEFNTTDVYGHIWFRVAVYKNKELVTLLIPDDPRPYYATLEAGSESKRVFARVTQDETPPQNLDFINPPKSWFTAKPLPLIVRAKVPLAHQAPIEKKVLFFKGKAPPPDGKIPEDAVLGFGDFNTETGSVSITLPPQEEGALVVTAQFMTRVGIPGYKTTTINVRDAKNALCTVRGTVAHGKLVQPNLEVVLLDEKGKAKATVKSGKKGEFVFEKVPPGIYVIFSASRSPAVQGQATITVMEGQEELDKVDIRLLAK